jgi:uncharacterized protein
VRMRYRSSFAIGMALTLLLLLKVASTSAMAADPRPIIGDWEGTLDPGAQPKKRIVVHITSAQDGSLNGTIDYPDQDASGIMMTAITYKEPVLHFECTSDLSVYDGTMSKDNMQIVGTLKQNGKSLDLALKHTP